MKALKVFEAYNFQRGLEPKRSLQVGKNKSLLYRALTDPNNEVNGDGFHQWMTENPKLAKAIEYDTNPLPIENYLTFDLDWYCEERGVESDELMNEFIPDGGGWAFQTQLHRSGEVKVKIGKIKNLPNSKIVFYAGGNIDGFITRKDWIGLK